MQAELSATYPGLVTLPLAELHPSYPADCGLWTVAAPEHVMPDGVAMFSTVVSWVDPLFWLGVVHPALETWLLHRGWTWKRHTTEIYILIPLSAQEAFGSIFIQAQDGSVRVLA